MRASGTCEPGRAKMDRPPRLESENRHMHARPPTARAVTEAGMLRLRDIMRIEDGKSIEGRIHHSNLDSAHLC